jgi:hypothetical protein
MTDSPLLVVLRDRLQNLVDAILVCRMPPAFTPATCSVYSSALKMGAIYSTETSFDFQLAIRYYIPKAVLFIAKPQILQSGRSSLTFRNNCQCGRSRTASVIYWSEFLATDPEARVRFPALPEKK